MTREKFNMVQRVRRSWQGLNVDLSSLLKEIIQFFESKKFDDITALQTETGYEVIAGYSKQYKMERSVSVTVEGKPEDFTVNLTSLGERKLARARALPEAIGWGEGRQVLYLMNLKSEEALLKLEIDFGRELNEIVARTKKPA